MRIIRFKLSPLCLLIATGLVNEAVCAELQVSDDDAIRQIAPATKSAVSLKSSILSAIGKSPQLAEIKSVMNVDHAQVAERKGAWLPQVFANGASRDLATNDDSQSEAWGVSVTQLLYDFGKTTSAIKKAEMNVTVDEYKIEASLNDVADKVTTLYVRAKRYQALIDIANENIVSLGNVEKLAKLRSGAGLSTSSDVLQAETRLIAMRTTLEDYRYQYALAMRQLAIETGINASDLSGIPGEFNAALVPFNQNDFDKLPKVKVAIADKQSAEYSITQAKAGHMPTVSLRAERAYGPDSSSSDSSSWDNHLTVNVSVPLYQGGIVTSQVDEAVGNVKSAEARIQQARMDAQQQIDSFFEDWKGAQARKTNSESQLKAALNTRNVYRNEYTLNTRSLNDLLSVEQDVFQAQQAKTMATYDILQAALSYSVSTNALLKSLNIVP
ncbi:TolC family outer membrane protein [Atlantibacter subterraneus]|uniref:TolC family outer membrane protein n=1 Tax=Atlantibacter subterraneus TaxID=255519 RepID=UPI0028962F5B|nr:TolC family outer membrane protein [Atlantibacter subterranea]